MGDNNLHWSRKSQILMRIGSSMSIIGSATICFKIFHSDNLRDTLSKTKQRLLLGMSIMDILNSIAYAFAAYPIPEDAPFAYDVYGNKGNTTTCEAQGFFIQLGFSVPLYSCSLCIYFLLVIQFGKTNAYISKKFEPVMHMVAIFFPLLTSFLGLALDLYNSNNAFCWIEPYPYKCEFKNIFGDVPCTRGINSYTYQFIFGGSVLLVSFLCTLISMICIVFKVWKLQSSLQSSDFRKTKEAGRQALLYIAAFLITWTWGVSIVLIEQAGYSAPNGIIYFFSLFQPMQGFWNVLVYLRPTAKRKYNLCGKFSKLSCLSRRPRSSNKNEVSNIEPPQISIASISFTSEDIKNNVGICDVTIEKACKDKSRMHKLPSFITIREYDISIDENTESLSSAKELNSEIECVASVGLVGSLKESDCEQLKIAQGDEEQ